MLGISNLNGQPKLVRPRIELDPLFNLLDYDETRDGFINALNSDRVVLGRTYRIDGQLLIPLRKTLRTDAGEPIALIVIGLKIDGALV